MTPRKRSYQGTAAPALRGLVFLVALTVGPACYAQQPLLQIASPSDGTTIDPGQTLTASVTSPANASFSGVFVISENPLHLPAAGVQADIVAHRMGGDIARTMALRPTFLGNSTYGQGTIHKLLTIDTPHLGSQLAGLLLQPNEEGGCVESSFALLAGNFVFNTVSFINGTVPGAVGDLTPSSNALQTIANGGQHPIPSALIAGVYTSFGSLSPAKSALGIICSAAGDPIANDLTPTGWPAIFNPQGNDPNGGNNDGIVSETSQLAGLPASSQNGVFVFTGLVHSPSLPGHFSGLGFFGPSVLDPSPADPIPNQVIELLNTPITDPGFVLLNQGLVAVHMGNSIFQLIVPIGE